MTVKMIVAVDNGNSIGWSDGRLPWRIPADMARFKALTMGHTVLMGRKTFESLNLPRGLPNRQNVVITSGMTDGIVRPPSKTEDNPYFFRDKKNPLKTYVQVHQASTSSAPPDLWIIGGASIYAQALQMELVDEIYLTQVHAISGADVILPFDLWDWNSFIANEGSRGIKWDLEGEPVQPPVPFDAPPIIFINLRKIK